MDHRGKLTFIIALFVFTGTLSTVNNYAALATTVKKTSSRPSPAATVRQMQGVWQSTKSFALEEGKWTPMSQEDDLGYVIIVRKNEICPRADNEDGSLRCVSGYDRFQLVPDGHAFLVKKKIVGSPVSNEKIIFRQGRLELITEGMGTAKYLLKKINRNP